MLHGSHISVIQDAEKLKYGFQKISLYWLNRQFSIDYTINCSKWVWHVITHEHKTIFKARENHVNIVKFLRIFS